MGKRSPTKEEAISRATQLAREGQSHKDIVAFLVSTYLYDSHMASDLANAALYRVQHGDTRRLASSVTEAELKAGWGNVKEVDESHD